MQWRHSAVQGERVARIQIADCVLVRETLHDALQIGALGADELANAVPGAGHVRHRLLDSQERRFDTMDGELHLSQSQYAYVTETYRNNECNIAVAVAVAVAVVVQWQ